MGLSFFTKSKAKLPKTATTIFELENPKNEMFQWRFQKKAITVCTLNTH